MNTWHHTNNSRFANTKEGFKRFLNKKFNVEIIDTVYECKSVYGKRRWGAYVFELNDGKYLTLSRDADGFDAAITAPYEMPSMVYDREQEQINLVRLAGLDRHSTNL